MAKEYQIREHYKCQCGQDKCQERIEPGQQYAVFKIVEKLLGEYKNKERKISHNCEWYKHWKEFLQQ